MRETSPPGHGERARIAGRVRALLAPDPPVPPARPDAPRPWLPGHQLEPHPRALPAAPGVPSPRRGLRWEPDRRAILALGAAVLVAALITGWWVLSSRPRQLAVQPLAASPGAPAALPSTPAPAGSAAASGGTASPGQVVVDVAGRVRRPGVYRLAAGARVIDALRAAGGVRAGVSTTALNLAAPVQDGEQVVVGRPAGVAVPSPGGGTGAAAPVALNTATLEQLETLPGVGPVLAQRILDWRAAHGRFGSVDQLDQVSGIGPATFAELRDRVTL